MIPFIHQEESSDWALATMRQDAMAYLAHKERTGKTLSAILVAEKSEAHRILVVTKKKALDGWIDTLKAFPHTKRYELVNYESLHKVGDVSFDMVIIDEAHHAIASIGKTSVTWKKLYPYTKSKPILYLSATPYAEHVGMLYHQFKLSSWSPFRECKNFYEFHRKYGIPDFTRTPYGLVETYKKYKVEEVLSQCRHLMSFKTRQDVGIEHEPTVRPIIIKPHPDTVKLVKLLVSDRVLKINGHTIMADSDSKLRAMHYQLESGTLKVNDAVSIRLGCEKINYIKANYDLSKIAIMCHFIEERAMMMEELPGVKILSSDGDAEGVDLSMYDKLIITSMSHRTSKFTQRLARQANHARKEPIEVDILMMSKPFIGYAIYESVDLKNTNFDNISYKQFLHS